MPEIPTLPPIADAPLSVILLARDDAAHLEKVTAGWVAFLNGLGREFELILVEDGSRDGSAELVTTLAERHPHLRVVCHELPRGEGAALTAGFAAARHPLVLCTRCEPRYQPGDAKKLLKEIDKVHLVSGFRTGLPVPYGVRLLERLQQAFSVVVFSHMPLRSPGWLGWKRQLGRWLVRVAFGVRSRDIGCPYRLLRREILARIPLQSRGSFARVELLAKANFLGHLIAEEVPLGDRRHPVLPEELRHERLRDVFADARRVFSHPDFGPVRLPEAPKETAVTPELPPGPVPDANPG